jgi:predicted PurR-regulated permease PerM
MNADPASEAGHKLAPTAVRHPADGEEPPGEAADLETADPETAEPETADPETTGPEPPLGVEVEMEMEAVAVVERVEGPGQPASDGPEESGGLIELMESALVLPPDGSETADGEPVPVKRVPVGTILASIAVVLAAAAAIELIFALQRVIGLLVIATFLAVVLSPAVALLVRIGLRRGLAVGIVFLVGLSAIGGLGYLFVHPLYREAINLSNQLPDLLAKTEAGKGPLGDLISKYHLQKTASQQIPKIRTWFSHLGGPALQLARKIVSGLGGVIIVMVLTFLILLEGPGIVRGALSGLPDRQARRVRRILDDVAKSVTGYVVGNFATSVIAGVIVTVTLLILRVPFAVVFGVWVAMVDLLPLIGGLLAGVPTVAFAFLHSPSAGIITVIVFLIYQQLENHILNPIIMSKTVRLNPLWVILSVLAGAQIASIIGALLAIPAAGAIQVIARDLWDEKRGEPRDPPTIGQEHKPI